MTEQLRDAKQLINLATELSERIELAAWGRGSWRDVCEHVTEAFPGSCAVLFSENPVDEILHHFVAVNMDDRQIHDFSNYFAFRNPWNNLWRNKPNNYISVSEREFPTRAIKNTEFYNDFIRYVPNFDAATGLQLNFDASSTIRLPLHYSVKNAENYDDAARFVLERIARPLERSIGLITRAADVLQGAMAKSTLIARTGSFSFVVDTAMKLIDTNPDGNVAVEIGRIVRLQNSRLVFTNKGLGERVSQAVRDLVLSPLAKPLRLTSRDERGDWLITFDRLPSYTVNELVSRGGLVLIQLRNMRLEQTSSSDLMEFSQIFGLTEAERKLCMELGRGASLADAAITLNLSINTVRQRIKVIFQKTETGRQAELIMLISYFR